MAERQGVLAGRTGKGTRTYFFDDGKFKEMPGLDNFSITANEPTATTYTAFEGSFAEVGSAEVGDATWDIVSFMPHHPAWKSMELKRVSQDSVQFRVEVDEVAKFSPATAATVALGTDGSVTFAGNGNGSKSGDLKEVARGMCFKIDGSLYTIESVSDDTIPVFLVEPPASAVSADAYSVVYPILRWEFSGIVKTPFGAEITREAPISSRFVITPTQIIPLPSIHTTTTGS